MSDIKLFADHCISNYIINYLKELGFEVYRLRDHIPRESPDQIVISKAQELNSILISLNGDFSDIITYPPANYKGIISLQLKNHPEIIPYVMKLLGDYLQKNPNMGHYKGKLFLVDSYRIRIKY
jgi:predicted nuclease of predicted toxin-antitoxin system